YLGSGVYPMLPPELSNGICSLNEGVDRLALVTTIDINSKGKIVDYQFEKAVINVKQAFSYENAEKVHLSQDGYDKKYAQAKPYTDILYEVTDVLERRLKNRGSLDFLNFEPEFKFNKEKNIVEEIENTGTERSHKVVEEFMILANEATAKYFKENEIDGIYRVHGKPNKFKMSSANEVLKKYNFSQNLTLENKSYQNLLHQIKDAPAKEYLNSVVMQTLDKAKYSAEDIGHFGLASTGYTHFTSPIRRYSDTIAHRIISEHLEYGKTTENKQHLSYIAEHLNNQEVKASKAEKESDKFLCCLWAEKHLDEVINGYIVNVSPAQIVVRHKGVTMQIPSLLLKNGLNAEYVLSNDLQTLKDKNSNAVYRVGDYIDFKIAQVDKSNYTIFGTADFELKNEKSKNEKTNLESDNLLL
ncbi:MAG: RNB domain-containing ribonuclease, partial [Christensenellales bacterium]